MGHTYRYFLSSTIIMHARTRISLKIIGNEPICMFRGLDIVCISSRVGTNLQDQIHRHHARQTEPHSSTSVYGAENSLI